MGRRPHLCRFEAAVSPSCLPCLPDNPCLRPNIKCGLGIWCNQEGLAQPHHKSGPHPASMNAPIPPPASQTMLLP